MSLHEKPQRIYLDNAATTWPKSKAAVAAAMQFIEQCGATSGRGSYASAQQAEQWLAKARSNIAQLIKAPRATDVAFCSSGTHALNAALGILKTGDHVVTSTIEHNSLLRPLSQLQAEGRITFEVAGEPTHYDGPKPDLVAVGHASNVTGCITELSNWRGLAESANCPLLVDASQTLGYIPIDLPSMGIDLLAAAGHKGLLGLQGTGLLVVDDKYQSQIRPVLAGGTGRQSESLEPDSSWPMEIEVGNLNLPGVVSLAVASEELLQLKDLRSGWSECFHRLVAGLSQLPQIQLLGTHLNLGQHGAPVAASVPVVSMLVEGWDIHDLAAILDTSFGVEVRAGFHCAALIHQSLKSTAGGTLRMSTSRHTTPAEVDSALKALQQILSLSN